MDNQFEFSTRSRYVAPMFFGEGTEIAVGDVVEAWADNVHVRLRVASIDGDALSGEVQEMRDDCRALDEHAGLVVGASVGMRADQVRSCWKAAQVA